jgi:hypothetical protein
MFAGEVEVRMNGENCWILWLRRSSGGAFARRVIVGRVDGGSYGGGYGGGRGMRFGERKGVVVIIGVGYEEVCGVHTASFNLFSSGTSF